eukprot:TRINITY_DN5185_c0_g1_i2.p1 TRINITY_DN5185_c0_g1~~TRINITY_DN5185_c0_g1_i2.p1  ORF type:complete len:550 (-),score=201.79 TRINITY_DN5185_c0_g1_i2:830-2413(-)
MDVTTVTVGSGSATATSNSATVYYVFDALVAARVVYGCVKSYFRAKFARQAKEEAARAPRKPVRVYMDGCFDMMHFGHANALRQAKALGDVLVVGINPTVEIMAHKGPPVMTDHERLMAVESVKWVDEVLVDVPYEVTPEFLDKLITEHQIDFIVHGDDPCIGKDGQDVYAAVKAQGRFRTVKRTEGVSSTDIVGRMLLCTRDHHLDASGDPMSPPLPSHSVTSTPVLASSLPPLRLDASPVLTAASLCASEDPNEDTRSERAEISEAARVAKATWERRERESMGGANGFSTRSPSVSSTQPSLARQPSLPEEAKEEEVRQLAEGRGKDQPFTRVSTFLPTTRRLIQFAGGGRALQPGDRVVYIDGGFDMFHCGHIETLQAARALGDFLLVGIHDDATVNAHKGRNFPIMNLHERTLSVLSCKYVDEVIIGAPWAVTEDMVRTMNISLVVHGSHFDREQLGTDVGLDAYSVPKELGIYQEVPSKSDLTVMGILDRIVSNRESYLKRNSKKTKQEAKYLDAKQYVQEL